MIEFIFGLVIGGVTTYLILAHKVASEVSMLHQDPLRMKRRVEAMQQDMKRFRGTL